jgi:hypothetical protein
VVAFLIIVSTNGRINGSHKVLDSDCFVASLVRGGTVSAVASVRVSGHHAGGNNLVIQQRRKRKKSMRRVLGS